MKKSCLLLILIILIAGCAQSQLDTAVKTLPQTKAFLEEYPEATIKTAVYSPVAIKNVVDKFINDCTALGEEGKSYFKVTITDEPSKQQLIAWLEAKDNKFVCAIRTSTAGEKVSTTTTSVPATSPIQTTTSSQSVECSSDATRCSGDLVQSCYNGKWTLGENCAYGCDASLTSPRCRTSPTTTSASTTTTISTTTTSANTTTTTIGICSSVSPSACLTQAECTGIGAANWCGTYCQSSPCPGGTTTTAQATTTIAPTTTTLAQPDLIISNLVMFTNTTHKTFQISVKNIGTATSPSTGLRYYVYYYDTTTGTNVTKSNIIQSVNSISAGSTVVTTTYFNYADPSYANGQYYFVAIVDPGNTVGESNENNNVQSIGFTKP